MSLNSTSTSSLTSTSTQADSRRTSDHMSLYAPPTYNASQRVSGDLTQRGPSQSRSQLEKTMNFEDVEDRDG